MVCQNAGESGVNCATFCHKEDEMRCIEGSFCHKISLMCIFQTQAVVFHFQFKHIDWAFVSERDSEVNIRARWTHREHRDGTKGQKMEVTT